MKKRLHVLLVSSLILAALQMISCSEQNNKNLTGDNEPSFFADAQKITEASEPAEEYVFPDANYEGSDFTILNIKPIWNFTPQILVETQIGEALNDAMYMRNASVEEIFGVTLKEITFEMSQIEKKIRTTITAGDGAYDVMYCPASSGDSGYVGSFAVEGLLCNLLEIPELRLDKEWWDKTFLEEGIVSKNRALYFAASDINLYCMQAPICVFFNQDMMMDLGLDLPYNAVKKGNGHWISFMNAPKRGSN